METFQFIPTLFRSPWNFPVHPDTLHIIWIFFIVSGHFPKYPEILQQIISLLQKLSGFTKTFRSALLTRWRGFSDSAILPSAILVTSRRQHYALKTILCNCIQGLLCSGTKTRKCLDLSTILLPGLSGRSTATCRTNCRLAPLLFFPVRIRELPGTTPT